MGAGEVAGRVDHRHDHQPEDEGDADGAERTRVLRLGDDRAATGEDEGESADRLSGGAADELGARLQASAAGRGPAARILRRCLPRRHREDFAHRAQGPRHETEVAVGAAVLAGDQPRLDELLEVVADGGL
jgi:hypothetical protein